tara:strand:+ start:317 stop:718 length:402 start_codon:yes stop_codon:yes gene_type:complete
MRGNAKRKKNYQDDWIGILMTTKYCQNRLCHYYNTTDRLRAKKSDNPYYVTRTARNYLGMFCSQGCLYEYFDMYKDRILIAIGEQGKRRRKKSDQNLWDSWRQQPEYNLNWDEGYHEARVRFTREWIRENVKE